MRTVFLTSALGRTLRLACAVAIFAGAIGTSDLPSPPKVRAQEATGKAGDAAKETSKRKPAAAKSKVAVLTIKGALPESAQQTGLLGELQVSLTDMIGRLDRAAQDADVSAVVLRMRSPSAGRGRLEELRAAIERVRKAGKKTIAELQDATAADYLLAVACEEIVAPESGVLMIHGVRAEVTYYKRLFDTLGVQADMMQVGDFKGAAEPLMRDRMSPEFRRQYETLLDDFYQQLVETIAKDRKLPQERVRELIDTGLFTADAARRCGLIDTVAYYDQWKADLTARLRAANGEVEFVDDYGKKKVDTEFSGMLGMVKLFEMMMGGEPSKRASGAKKVAVVYATGTIMTGESSSDLFGSNALGADTLIKALRTARDDKSVVAIVLRIDSPGGSALASDLIWRELQLIEKPVIASMGDVAASGGYYIAVGCDRIFAEAGTITGSIGVVGGKIAVQGLMEKAGVTTEVISRGKNSGLLSMNSPFTDSERSAWRDMMQEVYRQFTSKVATARKLETAQLEKLAGGRIWTGRQALSHQLVDEVGTLRAAIVSAKKAGGMNEGEKAELLILPEAKSFFDQLFGGAGATAPVGQSALGALASGAAASGMPAEWASTLAQVRQLQRLLREPSVLVMPYPVQIR